MDSANPGRTSSWLGCGNGNLLAEATVLLENGTRRPELSCQTVPAWNSAQPFRIRGKSKGVSRFLPRGLSKPRFSLAKVVAES